jgi:hypothetical protein
LSLIRSLQPLVENYNISSAIIIFKAASERVPAKLHRVLRHGAKWQGEVLR